MSSKEIDDIRAIVETWNTLKHGIIKTFTQSDSRNFAETMNAQSRKLIAALQMQDPELWDSLCELAKNAAMLTTKGAKLFVDGQDRTNL